MVDTFNFSASENSILLKTNVEAALKLSMVLWYHQLLLKKLWSSLVIFNSSFSVAKMRKYCDEVVKIT